MKKIIILVFVLLFSACGKVESGKSSDKSAEEAYQGDLSRRKPAPYLEKRTQENKKQDSPSK